MKLPSLFTNRSLREIPAGPFCCCHVPHCDIVDVLKYQDHHFRSHNVLWISSTITIALEQAHLPVTLNVFLCISSLFAPIKWKFEFRFVRLWKSYGRIIYLLHAASVGSLESYVANREEHLASIEPIETTMHRQVYTFVQQQSVIGIVSISYVRRACMPVRYYV